MRERLRAVFVAVVLGGLAALMGYYVRDRSDSEAANEGGSDGLPSRDAVIRAADRITGKRPVPPPVQGTPRAGRASPARDGISDTIGNPMHPDYDPVVFAKARGLPGRIVFDREARDEQWAPKMEKIVGRHIADDLALLAPDAEVGDIECRQSSCRVDLFVTPEQLLALNGPYPAASLSDHSGIGCFASTGDGRQHICFHLFFSREHRDPDAYESWYERHRAELLKRLEDRGELPDALRDRK